MVDNANTRQKETKNRVCVILANLEVSHLGTWVTLLQCWPFGCLDLCSFCEPQSRVRSPIQHRKTETETTVSFGDTDPERLLVLYAVWRQTERDMVHLFWPVCCSFSHLCRIYPMPSLVNIEARERERETETGKRLKEKKETERNTVRHTQRTTGLVVFL